jgi:hypothetical protein
MPRALHIAGRRPMPQFFDIDDTLPAADPPHPAAPANQDQPAAPANQDQPAPTTKEDQS